MTQPPDDTPASREGIPVLEGRKDDIIDPRSILYIAAFMVTAFVVVGLVVRPQWLLIVPPIPTAISVYNTYQMRWCLTLPRLLGRMAVSVLLLAVAIGAFVLMAALRS